jgi:outer membrane protein OmpA-like peptidoglycan-associated protein
MKNVTIFLILIISISFLFGFQQKSEGVLLQDANPKEVIENPDYKKDDFKFKTGMKFIFSYQTSESVKPSKEIRDFLDNLARWMVLNPNYELNVTGHSDEVGTPEKIQERSEKRANEIKIYLVGKSGISPKKIITSGHGSRKPITKVYTEEGIAKNRGVEIEIVDLDLK